MTEPRTPSTPQDAVDGWARQDGWPGPDDDDHDHDHDHLDLVDGLDPLDQESWLTAQVRPAGTFGRQDVGRLRALLEALSACASLVVLDLQAARLRSGRAAAVIDEAAARLEVRGGCLLCINADDEARDRLGRCTHALVVDTGQPVPVAG